MGKQIQSLERGLTILESIMFSDEPVTSAEIARRLGVHKSTVSHLTATLIEQGYLEKDAGSARLYPGRKLFRVARGMAGPVEVVAAARPHLERLAAETGETAHIAELRGRHVMFLENRYPARALRVQTATGDVEAVHSTAVGKALLSDLPDEEVRALFSGASLERFTEKTITDVEKLIMQLKEVRESGIAYDLEEQTAGTRCIAAPVRGAWGRVIATVGISGPVGSGSAEAERAVRRCAAAVEAELRKNGGIPRHALRERRGRGSGKKQNITK